MADRPPKVEFVGPQSVIERDSRQLLHVRAQNVNNLRFEGIRVPPLLLPLALAVEKSPADWDRVLDELKTVLEGIKPFMPPHNDLAAFVTPPLADKQLFPAAGRRTSPGRSLCRWAFARARRPAPWNSSGCKTTRPAASRLPRPGYLKSPI